MPGSKRCPVPDPLSPSPRRAQACSTLACARRGCDTHSATGAEATALASWGTIPPHATITASIPLALTAPWGGRDGELAHPRRVRAQGKAARPEMGDGSGAGGVGQGRARPTGRMRQGSGCCGQGVPAGAASGGTPRVPGRSAPAGSPGQGVAGGRGDGRVGTLNSAESCGV